jgi:WD40 repeat protein
VWDLAAGTARRLEGNPWSFQPAAFSPDGKTLAAGDDTTVRLWDVASGKERRREMGHVGPVHFAAPSPDGKTVVTAGADNTLRLWEVAGGKELARFGRDAVVGVCPSPDGRLLAQAGDDWQGERTMYLWDPATGREIRHFKVDNIFFTMAFSPDSKVLATGGDENRLWDPAAGRLLRRLAPAGRAGPGHASCLAFAPDGKVLAGGGIGFLALWEPATGRRLHLLSDSAYVSRIAFSAAGGLLASWQEQRPVALWDPATGAEVRLLGGRKFNPRTLLLFSPDGKYLALADPEGNLYLHRAATGKEVRRLPAHGNFFRKAARRSFENPKSDLLDLAFSPDGRTLACEGEGGSVHLWEVATGRERARWVGHEGGVWSLTFAADGRSLVSGGMDGTALVWDAAGGAKPARPEALEALWADLASPDAARAWRAVWALAAAPGPAVPFLRDRLRPAAAPEPARLKELLAALDDNDYAVRSRATEDLGEWGELAAPALREALAARPTPEKRRRLEEILAALDQGGLPAGQLRAVRAVEALEHAGTPEARHVLERLAGGVPDSPVTLDAAAALRRLTRRP